MARISKPPEVRRQEILDTAMELFAEKGYEDTSMADIARRMGVVQGLCYRYFDSKRVLFREAGVVDVDFVSCEPMTAYKGLEHFRPDLVRALDELHPRFMRFPGGCITHGLGLDNMYRWERTIGPVEHRPHNFNVWGYHQSFRIGFYEYFRLCETISAKPLPVLPAGVSCQNTSQGPVPIADEDMPGYIDSVIGLIDFCNADPETNAWAAKRAAMGHPEPFGLE